MAAVKYLLEDGSGGYLLEDGSGYYSLEDSTAPSVSPNSPADTSSVSTSTPQLTFTGTDAIGNDITYEVQVDTVNTFDSTPGAPYSVNYIDLKLAKFGSPTDNATLAIKSSSFSGTVLGTSNSIALSSLTTTATMTRFTFATPVALTGGVTYYMVLSRSIATFDAGNEPLWSWSGDVYAAGNFARRTAAGAWSNVTAQDGNFIIYDSALTALVTQNAASTGSSELYGPTGAIAEIGQSFNYASNGPLIDKLSNTDTGFTDITFNYSVDQSQTTLGVSYNWAVGGPTTTSGYCAQSFVPAVTGQLPLVKLKVNKQGSPTDNTFVEVRSTSPTGTLLATSNAIASSTFPTDTGAASLVEQTFTFASPATLTSGTTYYLVVKRDGADNASNLAAVGYNGNTSVYSSGDFWGQIGSTTYTELTSRDLYFKTYTPGSSDPFGSGDQIGYTVQAGNALTNGVTYYWRVRAKDPLGSNTYGAWTTTRSFTTIIPTTYTKTHSTDSYLAPGSRTLYWVGGSATWDGTAGTKWALTSGGSGGQAIPTAADNVVFDAASGAVTVTTSGTTTDVCNNITFTGFTGTFNVASSTTVSIYGNTTLASGMTLTFGNASSSILQFSAISTGKTITTAGKSIGGYMNFNGSGGGWTLQDNLTTTSDIALVLGTLDTNGKTVSARTIYSQSSSGVRGLTLGASPVTLSGDLQLFATANLTITPGTSSITFTSGSATFEGGGKTFYDVTMSGGIYPHIYSANTFHNLTVTGTVSKNAGVIIHANQTITGTLTLTGNSVINRLYVFTPSPSGTNYTLTAAAVSLSNVDFTDITGAGAASPFTGTSLGDAQGNSGITFTTATTRYWVGNGGNWSDTAHWSATSNGASGATVPLPHDAVVVNASSITSTSQTISPDMPRLGKDITFSGVANAPTFDWGNNQGTIYGSLTLGTGMTTSGTAYTNTLAGRGSHTINTNGVTITHGLSVNAVTGTYTLASNFTSSYIGNAFNFSSGTFSASSFNLTIAGVVYTGNSGNIRTINLGSGTWTFTGTGTVFDNGNFSGLTLNAGTSTIVISNTSATSKGLTGGGSTFYNLTITGDNVSIFNGFNASNTTFNTITLNNPGLTNGTIFGTASGSGNGTYIVSGFVATGTAGNLIKIASSASGTPFTLSKSSGVVSANYLSLKDSTATGGATFYAGANTTNVSGNTGWLFSNAPASFTRSFTTDANKKVSGTTRTHTTDSNKRRATTVTHTTSANKKVSGIVRTHTTDSNKKVSGVTKTHTTDALKRKSSTLTHTTDANKRISGLTRSHTTDANKKVSGFTKTHTTDSNKKKSALTKTHTTDSNKRVTGLTRSHTTDSFKRIQVTKSHTTDANKKVSGLTKVHTTDANKRVSGLVRTHTTDANKKASGLTRTHTTDSNKKKSGFTVLHTTDANKKTSGLVRTHTTDALKRKQFTVTHTTDSFRRIQSTKSHTTDANKKVSGLTRTHTSDANKKKSGLTRTHTADANKRIAGLTRSHTTGSLLRKQFTKTHTTDSLKRIQVTKTHTTDALKRINVTKTHTTDSNKKKSGLTKVHTADANKRKTSLVSHTTDSFIDTGKRYWVGGTAAWDGTAGSKWAAVSGGPGGFSVPTTANDVFFDANSGTGTVTAQTAVATPGNLDFTGFTGTFVQQSNINMGSATKGNLTLGSGMTYTYVSGQIKLSSTIAGNTYINTNGISIGNVAFNGAGATFILLNNLTSVGSVAFSGGTVDFNGYNLTGSTLSNGNTSTRTVNMRGGTLTITGTGSISDVPGGSLSYSWTTGAKFVIANTSATTKTFAANGQTLPPIEVLGASSNGTVTFSGTFTTDKFKFYPDANVVFTSGTTFTATTLDLVGTSGHPITITSTTPGSPATISVASGTISADYLALKDSAATGGATFYAGNNSTNNGGNTGWRWVYTKSHTADANKRKANTRTHTTDSFRRGRYVVSHTTDAYIDLSLPDRYWVGDSGTWSDTAHWSLTDGGVGGAPVPDATNDVHFTSNSLSADSTVVIDSAYEFNNFDCTTGFLLTLDDSGSGYSFTVHGSFEITTPVSLENSKIGLIFEAGEDPVNVNLNGTDVSFPGDITFGADKTYHITGSITQVVGTYANTPTTSFNVGTIYDDAGLEHQIYNLNTSNGVHLTIQSPLYVNGTTANLQVADLTSTITELHLVGNIGGLTVSNLPVASVGTDVAFYPTGNGTHTGFSYSSGDWSNLGNKTPVEYGDFYLTSTTDGDVVSLPVSTVVFPNGIESPGLYTYYVIRAALGDTVTINSGLRSGGVDYYFGDYVYTGTGDWEQVFLTPGGVDPETGNAWTQNTNHTYETIFKKVSGSNVDISSLNVHASYTLDTYSAISISDLYIDGIGDPTEIISFVTYNGGISSISNWHFAADTTTYLEAIYGVGYTGTFAFNGTSGHPVTVRSTQGSGYWYSLVDSTPGNVTNTFLDIQGSHVSGTAVWLEGSGYVDSGDNLGWTVGAFTRSHTTDALLLRQVTKTHTTDANKRKTSVKTHTTDSNKKKSANTRTYTTDSLKRSQSIKSHTTDALKRTQTTKTHTTDAIKRKAVTLTHTTNSLLRKQFTKTHTTDANKRTSGLTRSHTTDANKRVTGLVRTHTTDALKRTTTTKSHTTNALLRKQFTKVHSTDSFLRRAVTKVHTTDANLKKTTTRSHTTDANKKTSGLTRLHTTDANKRKSLTLSHTTDALKRVIHTLTHTTNSLIRKSFTKTYTTDSFLRKQNTRLHTTDANRRKTTTASHSTDANKRKTNTLTHTTSANKRKQLTVTHTTSANKRRTTTISHLTDASARNWYSPVTTASGNITSTVITVPLPTFVAGDANILIVSRNQTGTYTFSANVTATELANAGGRNVAFLVTPNSSIETSFTVTSTNAVWSWWIGTYRGFDTALTISTANNPIGNSTTSTIETPVVDLGYITTGRELGFYSAGVNSTATWTTTTDTVFSTTSGNAALIVNNRLTTAGDITAYSPNIDRGLGGTTRLESAISFVLQPLGNNPVRNLITDGSFELGSSSVATGWSTEGSTFAAPTFSISSTGVSDGKVSQRAQYVGQAGDSSTTFAVYQAPISANPGDILHFSVQLSGTLTNVYAYMGVEGFLTGGTYINENGTSIVSLSGTPTTYQVDYVVPYNANYVAVFIQFVGNNSTSVVDAYIDKAILTITNSKVRVHTTDANKRRVNTTTHTTDANKRKSGNTIFHATSSYIRSGFQLAHNTDANKKKSANVISQTTDSLLRKARTVVQTTDALLRKQFTKNHTTDANLKKTFTKSHTTDANKKKSLVTVSHTTNANKRLATIKTHTSDALKRIQTLKTHTTDALLRAIRTRVHATDSLKRKTNTVSHITDALRRKSNVLSHTTNTNKRTSGISIFHTTNALLRKAFTRFFTTDALIRKTSVKTHLTDALKRSANSHSHTTDVNKRAATVLIHTTSAVIRKITSISHTTDALLRVAHVVSHTTSSWLRKTWSLLHTADANKKASSSVSHTTDSQIFTITRAEHTTDAYIYTHAGTKRVIVNGQWRYGRVWILENDVWREVKVYYMDNSHNWIETKV